MARIKGVDIPDNKRIEISLTYIYGIGRNLAKQILKEVNIDPATKTKDLSPTLYSNTFFLISTNNISSFINSFGTKNSLNLLLGTPL